MLDRPPLALSLSGLATPDGGAPGPRAAIDRAAAAGFCAIQLDATAPGLRPRELDRSARRDLAAILRRSGLTFAGLDLWIPPEHLTDPARAERAADAVSRAVELAWDLVRAGAGPPGPAVSVALPDPAPGQIVDHLATAAARAGVRIADHALKGAASGLDVGVDPAALLLAGLDPVSAAARAGTRLASARLSDASTVGRVVPGAPGGRLDLTAYLAALSVAGYSRPVVLDVRGLPGQPEAARSVLAAW